ncbi:MAG: hypothetical protein HY782_23195 [Chloroflexi bacterium]|nr:hypothetical protein [Chloroflexota bacterium]
MKRTMFRASLFLLAVLVAACAPATPTPLVTPTQPLPPTATPTANFRATEQVILSHVFGTLTAAAPTRVSPPPESPAATPRVTTAPARATVRPANTVPPPPSGPQPTADPYLPQIPKGKGGVVVANYVGGRDTTFTINGKAYIVPSNGKQLIILDPGVYTFSVQIIGVSGGAWSDSMAISADQYRTYNVTGNPNQ